MNWKIAVLGLLLLDFVGLTAWVVATHGYLGFFEAAFASSATTLAFVDLSIMLGLGLAWMWDDARLRGATFWPYLLLTLGFGAAGPLAYLLARERHTLALREPGRAHATT